MTRNAAEKRDQQQAERVARLREEAKRKPKPSGDASMTIAGRPINRAPVNRPPNGPQPGGERLEQPGHAIAGPMDLRTPSAEETLADVGEVIEKRWPSAAPEPKKRRKTK